MYPRGLIFLEGTIKTAFIKFEGSRHGSVIIKPVGFNGIECVLFDKCRNAGNDVPVTHKTIQVNSIDSVDRFHCLAPADYQQDG